MKLKLATILAASATVASAATSVTLRNFENATTGLPIVDNTGAVLPTGELLWAVGTFDAAFAATLGDLDTEASDATVLAEFTQSGSAGAFNFDGLTSRTVTADDSGALGATGTNPLYVVVKHSPAGGDVNVMVLDFAINWPTQDDGGNATTGTLTVALDNVLYGGDATVAVTDQGNIPGAFTFADGITFDNGNAIPEPSTSLLASLAGLALIARRRR